jgi:RNA polymerase sigma factor (sigma-70 family)
MTTFFSVQDTSAVNDLRVWSEDQLIAAAKTGSRAPFGELCERHAKKVFRVIYRIMRNREDAEDAAQECFLNAFVHLKNFDGRSQFATWLTRIAINAALMKLRKNRGAREVPIDEPNPSSEPVAQREFRYDAPDPEESCSLRERKRMVESVGAAAASSQRCGAHPLTRTLNQRNCTNSGDFDRGCKDADVSREKRAASNALAAKCRQLQLCQASCVKRYHNDSNNQGGNFSFCANQDRSRFKSDALP